MIIKGYTSSPRAVAEFGGALLVVLLAFGWCHGSAKHAAAVARAELHEQRADSLYLITQESERALETLMTQENVRIVEANRQRDSALVVANAAANARPRVIERIVREAGIDSAVVRRAVEEVVAYQMEEISALRMVIEQADSINTAKDRQLAATTLLNADLRAALEASRTEAQAWEEASKPSFLGIHIEPEFAFIVGLGLGLAVTVALR